jgi:hypothetical protein
MLEESRLYVFEEAAKQHIPGVIFTFTHAEGRHERFVRRLVEVVERYGGEVDFVQLYCQPEELERRVVAESRTESFCGLLLRPTCVESPG